MVIHRASMFTYFDPLGMYNSSTLRSSTTRSPLHFLHRSLSLKTLPVPLQELQIDVSGVTRPGPIDRRPFFTPEELISLDSTGPDGV